MTGTGNGTTPTTHPFVDPPQTSRVTVDADTLTIRRLCLTDPDVVAGARRHTADGGALVAYVTAAMAVGARAVAAAGPVAGVDTVSRRIDELARRVTHASDAGADRMRDAVEKAADERTGTVAVAVRDALERLAGDVGRLVSAEDAPLRTAITRSLQDATTQAAGRVERALTANADQVRTALSPTDPTGPIAALRHEVRQASRDTTRELTAQLADVRSVLAAAGERASLMERTAIKGAAYEEEVLRAVTEVANAAGDTVAGTGNEVGLVAHAKSGDAVVTVSPLLTGGLDVRLVVEAKDARLSSERWRRELDAGQKNRAAAAGLGVVRDPDRMPGGRRRVLVLDPLRVVVAWDPATDPDDVLAAAYALVRASAVQAVLAGTGGDDDRAELVRAVREAHGALDGFDSLERATGTARRGLEDLAKATDTLRAVLHAHLIRGLRLTGPRA